MTVPLAVIIALIAATIITYKPPSRYIAHPEIWCQDPMRSAPDPESYCEFKLRDA